MEYYPTTLKEAEIIFAHAIESDDFELAEEIINQIPDLRLLQEEKKLGHLVDGYLIEKEKLADQADSNRFNYEQTIQKNIDLVQKEFTKQFNSIKKKQEDELKTVYEQWRVKREQIEENSVNQYEDTLQTARILASQTCFKEAKAIRDSAYSKKTNYLIKSYKSLSSKYGVIIKAMMNRHEAELQALIKRRDLKIQQMMLEMESAKETAQDCYEVDNADNVVNTVNISRKTVPLALIMQTKDDNPAQSESEIFSKSDKIFKNKMKTYKQVFAATDVMPNLNKPPTQKNRKSKTFRTIYSAKKTL